MYNEITIQEIWYDDFEDDIDMIELIDGLKKSEDDILNGRLIEYRDAMKEIHQEVFGETI